MYDEEQGYVAPDATYAGDHTLDITFYKRAVRNESKSLEAGRPIFEEQDFIKIVKPGDTTYQINTPMHEGLMKRPVLKDKYELWLSKNINTVVGTPLTEWSALGPSQIAEFTSLGVKTVEQLADMPDNLAQKFMGSQQIRAQAKAFLAASKDNSHAEKLATELEKRDSEIAELQKQMAELIKASKAKPEK